MSTGANISKHPIFFPVVGTDRSHVKADLNVQRYGDDRAHIQFSTAGDMPLTLANGNFGPPFAPDIDTHVELTYFKCGDELHLSGRVFGDTFPNAEIFLTDSLRNSVLLGGHTTAGGEMLGPFMYLWGSGKDDTGEFIKFDTHISLDAKGRFLENR